METQDLLYYLKKMKGLSISMETSERSENDVLIDMSMMENLVLRDADEITDLDSVPIAPKYNNFNKLLEEELKKDIAENVSNDSSTKRSRPFLRKGEGMHRFGFTKKDIGLTKIKMPWKKKMFKSKNVSNEKKYTIVDDGQNFRRKLNFESFKDMSDDSVLMSPSLAKATLQKEVAEQRVFELLERKVENPVFNSDFFNITNSVVSDSNSNERLQKLHPPPNTVILNKNEFKLDNNRIYSDSTESSDTEETCKIAEKFIPTSTPNQEYSNEKHIKGDKKIVKIVINKNDTLNTPEVIVKRIDDIDCSETLSNMDENYESDLHDYSFKRQLSKSELLAKKLKELENEIEIFQTENATLQKFAEELAKEKSEFIKEKALMESKLREEKVLTEYYLSEEKEKLQKQKSLYDRYVRDLKGQISKKEREETYLLQKDIDQLKEQITLKDAKFGATQAKLRNQIKSLENDNKTLREECDGLKKENRKLIRSNERTRRLSNIKLLADINKTASQINMSKNDDLNMENTNVDSKKRTYQKPTVVQHTMRRTKSTPNLTVTSRYAKYFSERDKDVEDKQNENGYTLQSESEDDSTGSERDMPLNRRENVEKCQSILSKRVSIKENDLNKTDIQNHTVIEEPLKFQNVSDEKYSKSMRPTLKNNKDYKENNGSSISKIEKVREDGNIEINYSNGNRKIASPDGAYSKFIFYNGDVKEVFYNDGIIKYFYREPKVYHTSYKDGSEVLQFPDGYIEHRYPDGSIQAHHSNGTVKWIKPGNNEEWRFPDGTSVSINSEKEQIFRFPNGQVEIHTAEYKKREFPDGTVKIAYMDGVVETRYASGRIRIKDKYGNLIMDTLSQKPNLKQCK